MTSIILVWVWEGVPNSTEIYQISGDENIKLAKSCNNRFINKVIGSNLEKKLLKLKTLIEGSKPDVKKLNKTEPMNIEQQVSLVLSGIIL